MQAKDDKLADVNKIIADTQSRERQLVADANASLEDLTEKLQALQQQLDALHEFKERQVSSHSIVCAMHAPK
jgi:TPP-dependent trihydroxycyclohexane-1,2-dione (THcHDO) dehydratase